MAWGRLRASRRTFAGALKDGSARRRAPCGRREGYSRLHEEASMNPESDASPSSPDVHFVAAALAAIITVGIFSGVTELLLHEGRPLEHLVAAERACAGHEYVSEREACMREWIALRRVSLAGR